MFKLCTEEKEPQRTLRSGQRNRKEFMYKWKLEDELVNNTIVIKLDK